MVSRSAAAPAQHVAARPNQDNDLSQAFVEVPRDDVPAAVAALDGALLGSKRLKARPADKRAAVAPDRSDRSSNEFRVRALAPNLAVPHCRTRYTPTAAERGFNARSTSIGPGPWHV